MLWEWPTNKVQACCLTEKGSQGAHPNAKTCTDYRYICEVRSISECLTSIHQGLHALNAVLYGFQKLSCLCEASVWCLRSRRLPTDCRRLALISVHHSNDQLHGRLHPASKKPVPQLSIVSTNCLKQLDQSALNQSEDLRYLYFQNKSKHFFKLYSILIIAHQLLLLIRSAANMISMLTPSQWTHEFSRNEHLFNPIIYLNHG